MIDSGKYLVSVESLFVGICDKTTEPVLICTFQILEGPERKKIIEVNHGLKNGFKIAQSNTFLTILDGNVAKFNGFYQYCAHVEKIFRRSRDFIFRIDYNKDGDGVKRVMILGKEKARRV